MNGKDGTIIFLHGLGSNSRQWEDKLKKLFSSEKNRQQENVKIFCPKSSQIPMTIFQDNVMNAWFNVYDIYNSDNQDICNAAGVSVFFLDFNPMLLGEYG